MQTKKAGSCSLIRYHLFGFFRKYFIVSKGGLVKVFWKISIQKFRINASYSLEMLLLRNKKKKMTFILSSAAVILCLNPYSMIAPFDAFEISCI